MTLTRTISLLAVALLLAGCGGGSDESAAGKDASGGAAATQKPAGPNKGIGPIAHVDVAMLTAEDAARGAEIFESKCTACHKLSERYVGPALEGVTSRRAPEWIMNMIINPDEMVQKDPDAKALFHEFLTPMTNQNIDEADAKALLAYLKSVDESSN